MLPAVSYEALSNSRRGPSPSRHQVGQFRRYSESKYTTVMVMSSRNSLTMSCGSDSMCDSFECSTPYSVPPSALRIRCVAALRSSGFFCRPAFRVVNI
uniref:Uncharacterized protein n=1 Tax=Anopheles quadriannulatus TaxID=34691 RepID=A0A182XTP8_ANOQN